MTQQPSAPFIPSDMLPALSFHAPMWGISMRPAEGARALTWVQLVVDFDIQVNVWVLTWTYRAPELMQRAERFFVLRHVPEGVLIEAIMTNGLGYTEDNGYSRAVVSP